MLLVDMNAYFFHQDQPGINSPELRYDLIFCNWIWSWPFEYAQCVQVL